LVIELLNRYHKSHLYIIDVSQSVEHDHPAAFDFLRADIKNVDEFWARRGAQTLGLRSTFDFVVSDNVIPRTSDEEREETATALRAILTALIETKAASTEHHPFEATERAVFENVVISHAPATLSRADMQRLEEEHSGLAGKGADEQLEDAVFLRSYIPRNLNEVFDPERDAAKVRRGEGGDLIYGGITGVVEANKPFTRTEVRGDPLGSASVQKVDAYAVDQNEDSAEDVDEGDSGQDDGTEEESEDAEANSKRAPRGHRHEDKDAKKVRHDCT
jgi:RIO kinase 1